MRRRCRTFLLVAGLAAVAFGCSRDVESSSPSRWSFHASGDAVDPPPQDASDTAPDDEDTTTDGDDTCPDDVQPRDGTCNEQCSGVDPDCAQCPNPGDSEIRYTGDSYRDPTLCDSMNVECPEGWEPFHRQRCGCGCRKCSDEDCDSDEHEECSPMNSCDPDEYCDYRKGGCGKDPDGACRERPEGCSNVWEPVCGCDEQTYRNPCQAYRNGVDFRYRDTCN